MKIAVTGASGLIGSGVGRALSARGDAPVAARRQGTGPLVWSVEDGFSPRDGLSGYDAIIHLAGENLAGRRWTPRQKQRIVDSRVRGTRAVVTALEHANPRPKSLVCGSAVGVYGDRGDEILGENAELGNDFLATLCRDWEDEARRAEDLGVRLCIVRTGLVMSTRGGPLAKMLPAFRIGAGARLGDGRQWMSWIHEDDLVRIILRAIDDDSLPWVLNASAPNPVTNAEFTKILGAALRRPAFLAAPGFALRAMLGELSSALLSGQRVIPEALTSLGFEFEHPELAQCLSHLLDRRAS